jgi:hypothetical protein
MRSHNPSKPNEGPTPATSRPLRSVSSQASAREETEPGAFHVRVGSAHTNESASDRSQGEGGDADEIHPLFRDEERAAAGQIVRDALRATKTPHKIAADAMGFTARRFEKALSGHIALDWRRVVALARHPATASTARVLAAQLNTLADHATPARGLPQTMHVTLALKEIGEWAARVSKGETGPEVERELLDVIDACQRALADVRAASGALR